MTLQKTLHPRDDVDRLHMPRKKGGRRLTRIEDSVGASIQRLGDNIEKRGGRLITANRNNTDNTRISRTEIMGRKKTLRDISSEKMCKRLRKGNLK